jgi:predicted O-methyltransferase YrrM
VLERIALATLVRRQRYRGAARVKQLCGDWTAFTVAPHAPIDMFFIVGFHDHTSALQHTRNAWQCLRPGGVVVWHDFPWQGVKQAVRDADLGLPITAIWSTSLALARKLSN